ncbi:MAG: hypothetical protein QOG72_1550 [Sphingomonadales bacterium]|jgi:hypothetical protein|nr:hypothetical protein [Sphingomonadales bacterium]
MTVEALAFIFGCLLIFAAISGRDITVRELTIPALPPIPRALCGLLGGLLMAVGFGVIQPRQTGGTDKAHTPWGRAREEPQAGYCPPPPSAILPAASGVELRDRLGDNQEFERIDVYLSGRGVGTLCVDRARPISTLVLPLSEKAERYRLSGSEMTRHPAGDESRTVTGEGMLDLRKPARYAIRAGGSTNSVERVRLEPY